MRVAILAVSLLWASSPSASASATSTEDDHWRDDVAQTNPNECRFCRGFFIGGVGLFSVTYGPFLLPLALNSSNPDPRWAPGLIPLAGPIMLGAQDGRPGAMVAGIVVSSLQVTGLVLVGTAVVFSAREASSVALVPVLAPGRLGLAIVGDL